MLFASVANAFFACGGTNGLEGIPQLSSDASLGNGSDTSADTTAPIADVGSPDQGTDTQAPPADTGSGDLGTDTTITTADGGFDADIQYADAARLPDLGTGNAASDAADAAAPTLYPWDLWPPCAPDLLVVDDAGNYVGEFPDDDVYDAGSCATYSWTHTYPTTTPSGAQDAGALTCDQCMRLNACGIGAQAAGPPLLFGNNGILPPCSDLREAGTAAQGDHSGDSLFSLCARLFECVTNSSCVTSIMPFSPDNCYCGTATGSDCLPAGAANGSCVNEIRWAFQAVPTTMAADILQHLTDISDPSVYAGSQVMNLFQVALVAQNPRCPMCFSDGGDDAQIHY